MGVTKDELYIVNNLSKEIRQEQNRLLMLNDWISRVTIELDGLPYEQGYKRSRIEELTTQKVDCEKKIEKLKQKCAESRAGLIKTIDEVIKNNDMKAVMVERYSFGKSFKKIAEKLHMSENNVFYLHRKGMKLLLT